MSITRGFQLLFAIHRTFFMSERKVRIKITKNEKKTFFKFDFIEWKRKLK